MNLLTTLNLLLMDDFYNVSRQKREQSTAPVVFCFTHRAHDVYLFSAYYYVIIYTMIAPKQAAPKAPKSPKSPK